MNLNELAREWEEYVANGMVEQLANGDYVHVITGDLLSSFDADQNTITSDVHYALTELHRPGTRSIDPHTPHNALELAWEDYSDDAVSYLEHLVEHELRLPEIRININARI